MTTFAPALHLQNDNIHTKIKAQMIIKDPGSSITHFIGMLCAIVMDYSHLFLKQPLMEQPFLLFQ